MTLAEASPAASDLIADSQRADYEANGYLCLPNLVGPDWLDELRSVTAEFIEASRSEIASGKVFDLEPTHTPEAPRLRRLVSPVDQHPTYARFAFEGPPAQLASALLGGPVRYHHSKLNFKWSGGGEASQMLTIDGRQMHGAPDWSRKGPPTIFGSQQKDG